MRAALIYPHQLFSPHPALPGAERVYLIEDPLFFSQYAFHKQKLMLHRASMQRFSKELKETNPKRLTVRYVEAHELSSSGDIGPILVQDNVTAVQYIDAEDDWLRRRLERSLAACQLPAKVMPDPYFLTPLEEWDAFSHGKKRLFFTEFYIRQRKRLKLLLDKKQQPLGGKWSFDPENRRKLPKGTVAPPYTPPPEDAFAREARIYVRQRFPNAPGDDAPLLYPASRLTAQQVLQQFLDERLPLFGDYEDAISREQTHLFHSVLTPPLNIGLLSPLQVLEAAVACGDEVPLNALEGFVRQVCGWREYIRGVYRQLGVRQRTRNYWNHTRPLPQAFYDGTTGIEPVDCVIRRVLRHGYCHHIERLMILGNFMLLCEIDPDDIYRWFMELFVDAYDWVMVPNVYGMSQFADGGLITTKPYLSGSSYVLRMSDFRRGRWCEVWDALYWRFIGLHRDFFAANPRMSVMVKQFDKLGPRGDKLAAIATDFLAGLK